MAFSPTLLGKNEQRQRKMKQRDTDESVARGKDIEERKWKETKNRAGPTIQLCEIASSGSVSLQEEEDNIISFMSGCSLCRDHVLTSLFQEPY